MSNAVQNEDSKSKSVVGWYSGLAVCTNSPVPVCTQGRSVDASLGVSYRK